MWSPFRERGEPEREKKSNIDEANRHIEALDAKACSLSEKLRVLQARMEQMERETAGLRAERDSLLDILQTATSAFTQLRESGGKRGGERRQKHWRGTRGAGLPLPDAAFYFPGAGGAEERAAGGAAGAMRLRYETYRHT